MNCGCMPKVQGQSMSRDSSGARKELKGERFIGIHVAVWGATTAEEYTAEDTGKFLHLIRCYPKQCFSNLTMVQNRLWALLKI